MPNTTSLLGRQRLVHPDLGYQGGATGHGLIRDIYSFLSNQVNIYYENIGIAPIGTVQVSHKFGVSLSNLKITFFENGAPLQPSQVATNILITQVNTTAINIQNLLATAVIYEVYISPKRYIHTGDFSSDCSISTTGNISCENLNVAGNLDVSGTLTTINSTELEVKDSKIRINNGGNNATAEGSGIEIEGDSNSIRASLLFDSTLESKFKAGLAGSEIELVNLSATQTLTNKNLDLIKSTAHNDAATGILATLSAFTSSLKRLTGASLASVRGIALSGSGCNFCVIYNSLNTNVLIENEVAAETATQRIVTGTGASLTLRSKASLFLVYDTTSQIWLVVGGSGGGGITNLPVQLLNNNASITGINVYGKYKVLVSGSSNSVTLNPQITGVVTPEDGTEILLVGTDNLKTVTVQANDVAGGFLGNGDCTLGKGCALKLIYDSYLGGRFLEVSRTIVSY